MGSCQSGAGRESGFAGRRPQSRFWLERGASAAISVTINGLVLVGLGWSLTDSRRWTARPDPSPAITVITLTDLHPAKPSPKKDRRASSRPATSTNPTIPAPVGLSKQAVPLFPLTSSLPRVPATPAPAIDPPVVPAALPTSESSTQDAASVLDAYRQQLWAIIAAHRPPGIHLDGEVGIRFVLDADGGLRSASVARSSGDPMMDRLALGTVRRAAPFPKPPLQGGAPLAVEIRFRFR